MQEDVGGVGSIPGSERSPGRRNGNPLQYSCVGNPRDRGAWQATVHGVTRVGRNLPIKQLLGVQDTAETVRSGKRRQVSEETAVSRIRRGTWFHAQTHIQWRLEEPRGSGL